MLDTRSLFFYGIAIAGLVALVAVVLTLTDMPWPADLGLAIAALMFWPMTQSRQQGGDDDSK